MLIYIKIKLILIYRKGIFYNNFLIILYILFKLLKLNERKDVMELEKLKSILKYLKD